ncbi:MAG: guanine deaminase, partial [Psychrobacter glaciei]
MAIKAYRSSILHFKSEAEAEYFDDGILVVDGDTIKQVGNAIELLEGLGGIDIQIYQNKIIMPGFIDTHIHYPQVDVIASYGEQLLDWLNNYTFPTEIKFEDPKFA